MAKRHMRWDRVVGAVLALLVLIVVLVSCVSRCGEDTPLPPPQTTGVTGGTTTQPTAGTALSGVTDASGVTGASSVTGASGVTEGSSSALTALTTTTTAAVTAVTPSDYIEVPTAYEEIYRGSLILVTEINQSHLEKSDLDLVQVHFADDNPGCYAISYPGQCQLSKTALSPFNRLMKDYYTSTNNQEIMFNYGYLETGKQGSNPDSPTGLDVQLHLKLSNGNYDYISNTSPYSWIYDHMDDYGFIVRYPKDKGDATKYRTSHPLTALRYVGVPHAQYITENDLCLEEYIDLLRSDYAFGQKALEIRTGDKAYSVYYVKANTGGETMVPVPLSNDYTISGNNVDGFIVTVSL